MPKTSPRIGAHTPTSGGMAKRAIAYAETIGAEAIQVFTSNPRRAHGPCPGGRRHSHAGGDPAHAAGAGLY